MKTRTYLAWALRVLLALAFLAAGGAKVAGNPGMRQNLVDMGYPAWSGYLIGSLEVLGAVALLLPRFVRPAALGLLVIMLGAVGSHVFLSDAPAAAGAAALLGLGLLGLLALLGVFDRPAK